MVMKRGGDPAGCSPHGSAPKNALNEFIEYAMPQRLSTGKNIS